MGINIYLPGIDALKSAGHSDSQDMLGEDVIEPYLSKDAHWRYLDNPSFHEYVRMSKVIVDTDGAQKLIEIADDLANETMPRFLDAAGWAYAEAGLALSDDSAGHRVQLITAAERIWHRALTNDLDLGRRYQERWTLNEDMSHRLALNLAFAPLIKSIIVGNVAESVRSSVMQDTVSIAADSIRVLDATHARGDIGASGHHQGFLFEANGLMALLYMNDARYVPLPSTARADTGYYFASQTHDISIINQHWGEIRKVIPVEIKSRSTRKDRQRYKALLIRGKMHLSVNNYDPRTTVRAFQEIANGTASVKEINSIEAISNQLRNMLRLYQQGVTPEGFAIDSLTRFHDTNKVAEVYPELSKLIRKS
jgi:hypothetical protein